MNQQGKHSQVYIDRFSKESYPDEQSIVRDRTGAGLILLSHNSILLNLPKTGGGVMDLPGGGIEGDETHSQAAVRELLEETEIELDATTIEIDKTHKQFMYFCADDLPEYWNYDQTFFLVSKNTDKLYFEGRKKVSEGYCLWVSLDTIDNYQVQNIHKRALYALGLVDNYN